MAALGLASRQRAHGLRRRALHSLSLALARHPRLVACARAVARARRSRVARIALSRELVMRLAAATPSRERTVATSVLHEGDVATALLVAILRAAGERAVIEYTREMPLVRVAVAFADVHRLPPWARLVPSPAGALEVAVAMDGRWVSAAYVPPVVRGALDRRDASARRTALAS